MTHREAHPEQYADLEDAKARRAAKEAALDTAIRRALSGDETDSEIARRLHVGTRRVAKVRKEAGS